MSPPLPDHKLLEAEEEVVLIEEEEETEEEAEIEVEAEEAAEVVAQESQDLMLKETQSRRESTSHTEESQERMLILTIENPALEEEESQTKRRADTEDTTTVTSQPLNTSKRTKSRAMKKSKRRRFKRSQSQSQSQRWSNSLSLSTSSWPTKPDSERRRPELPRPSREPRLKLEERRPSNPLFSKTNMLRTPLPKQVMLTTFTSDSQLLVTMMISHPEAEAEEVEEVAEAAMPVPEEEELGDKTLSKPLRRPKRNSQHYERDGDPV